MQFRTRIPLISRTPKIDYNSKIFLLGSCFVENIGGKLNYFKFQSLQNPFGILFHPVAIEKFLDRVASGYNYSEEDVFYHNERWHCFETHSVLSHSVKNELINNLNAKLQQVLTFLKDASHFIITPGTAWGYNHIEKQEIVANCHKLPQRKFKKELSSVQDVKKSLENCISHIRSINADINIIFTVSPVRHLKDGFIENQWSKANLLSAMHEITYQSKVNSYFPSYEIMMDELRDYRFYKEDMVHPSALAVTYIWERFVEVYFSSANLSTMEEVEKIQRRLEHRAFSENSEAHQKFLSHLQFKIQDLKVRFPHMQFR